MAAELEATTTTRHVGHCKEDEEPEDAFVLPEESEVPAFTPPSTAGEEVGKTVSGLAACVELLADPKAHQTGELTEEVAQQLFQGLPVDCSGKKVQGETVYRRNFC